MASAQQMIGLIKSHAEGNEERFFDLAMQLAVAEEQKGHNRLAEQLRQWAEAGRLPPRIESTNITPLAAPKGPLSDLLSVAYPGTRLSSVVLPESIAQELRHLVIETRQRHLLEEKGLFPRRRVLLVGPPGTGKTLTGSALATELKLPLYTVLLHGIISKFMGESAQKLRMVFDALRTTRGVYLFDEIDALAGARNVDNDVGEARRLLNSFLQFLDEDTGSSLIVATTNLPNLLDHAILRRFDIVLSYHLPDKKAIQLAIQNRLVNFPTHSVDWSAVAQHFVGLSVADVVSAAEDAARRSVIGELNCIDTPGLIAAAERRNALQGVGKFVTEKNSSSLSAERSRKKSAIQPRKRRGKKASK